MKQYLIKIDLNSITENLNAGDTTSIIQTDKILSFKTQMPLHPMLKSDVNCLITNQNVIDNVINVEGIITDKEVMGKLEKHLPENMTISIDVKYSTIHHRAIEKYSYRYCNTKVKCTACGENINTFDLKTDEIYNGVTEIYSDTICPKCGEWDCVNLKFENIIEALKRLNSAKY